MALTNHACCQAFQNAYLETADEDDNICERMHEHTKQASTSGDINNGLTQIPIEEGLSHFHSFLKINIGK